MKKRIFCKTRLLSLVLSLTLLIGLIPTTISAQNDDVYDLKLLAGIYDLSEIKSAPYPGMSKGMFVFTSDFGDRDVLNRSELVFSIIGDQSCSRPVSIKDDGTWDMEPFIYSDNNDGIIVWTNATKGFNEESTGEDIASALRISLAVCDSNNTWIDFKTTNVSYYNSDNISTYNPKVTKVAGKILVSWVVCHDVKNDNDSYGIEGLYYNPETNAFYSENNLVDENGRLVPMVFAKNCNYIASYSVAKVGNETVTIFEEPTEQTHVSDVMYDKVMTQKYSFYPDKYKPGTVKMSVNNGNDVTNLTDGTTHASVVDSDIPGLTYYNKGKIYEVSTNAQNNLIHTEFADVSKTGDTEYSIISKNGVLTYITALQYEPLKTSNSTVSVGGKQYEKATDGKWLDENGNARDLKQENVCLYYINPKTGNIDVLPKKIYDQDALLFLASPSFTIDSSNKLCGTYFIRQIGDSEYYDLYYSTYTQKYLFQADYSQVNDAIAKATALNKDDYKDFTAVTAAIDAVVRDKDYTEQANVDAMAKAIEDAIDALELKPVDKPKIIEGANQFVEQGKSATFKSSAELTDFQKILIDGNELDPSNYTLMEGSTIVTIKGEFVKTLSVGKHTLSVVSTTGSAETQFTVTEVATTKPSTETTTTGPATTKPANEITTTEPATTKADTEITTTKPATSNTDTEITTTEPATSISDTTSPQTGENSNIVFWMAIFFISAGGVLTLTLKRKKSSK